MTSVSEERDTGSETGDGEGRASRAGRAGRSNQQVGPTPKGRSPSGGLRRAPRKSRDPACAGRGYMKGRGFPIHQFPIRLVERRRFYARAKRGATPMEIANVSRETRRGNRKASPQAGARMSVRRGRACRGASGSGNTGGADPWLWPLVARPVGQPFPAG
jgi:hypothetical protein